MSITIPFDTLTYARRLEDAGCDKRLAEEHAKVHSEIIAKQSDTLADLIKNTLATKADLERLETKLERKIEKVEHSLLFKLGSMMIVLVSVATTILGFLITTILG